MLDSSIFNLLGGIVAQSGVLLDPEPPVQAVVTGVPFALAAFIGVVGMALGAFASTLMQAGRITKWKNEKDEAVRFHQESTLARAEAVSDKDRIASELVSRNQELDIYNRQLQSLNAQIQQSRDGWKNSENQLDELTKALKEARGQADKLRQNLAESERMSGDRAAKVIALNSQLEETQSRLSESLRTAAERQSNLSSANGLISRQRARLAEIGYITTEVQSTVNSMSLHLDSLRQRVLVDPNHLDSDVPPLPLPVAPLPLPVVSPSSTAPLSKQPTTQPPTDFAEDLTKSSPKVAPRMPLPPLVAPASVESALGVDPGDFSGKVSSLAENLGKLSSIINNRGNLPPDPLPDPRPAPAPRSADPAPNRQPPVMTEATTINASYPALRINAAELSRLQGIKGVGVVYAMRLSQNGVSSVSDLANASIDQLDVIIKAPRWRKPNYADWISQAKQLLAVDGKLEVAAAPASAL